MNTKSLPRVRQLAPGVAEAIAAGEVIERPASVVKELLENSLDAGATRISVELSGGGLRLIRVTDDGCGMESTDLAAAFRRHATSKLSTLEDLSRVRSLGFRGEALASIAAVARVSCRSAPRSGGPPAVVELGPDGRSDPRPAPAAPGTVVAVRDLFANVPARLKFLRAEKTEVAACSKVVADAILGRPDVSISLSSETRSLLRSSGGGSLRDAIRAVFGPEPAAAALEVSWSSAVSVTGMIAPPQLARPSRAAMVITVNGRRVHQAVLTAAVEGGYRGLLPAGRYPLAVLDIALAPEAVDVNVHPTKREVRFREPAKAFEAVERACWEALRRAEPTRLEPLSPPPRSSGSFGDELSAGTVLGPLPSQGRPERSTPLLGAAQWVFLGQAHRRYLVVQTDDGLAVLDQHAVHEKILYEQFLEAIRTGRASPSQGLLQPLLLEVGQAALGQLERVERLLQRAGFEVDAFGPGVIRCSAVPSGLRVSGVEELLAGLLSGSSREDDASSEHRLAASAACHAAVRFGDTVAPAEASAMLSQLAATSHGITCPHGRPAVLLLGESQLLSAFRRHL